MAIGGYISTVGHVGVLGYMLFGPGFAADPLPMEDVQQVSVISEAEFAALMGPIPSPVTPIEPVALAEPELPEEVAPPAPEDPVEAPPPPAPAPPAEPDPIPVPPAPAPEAEVTEEVIAPPLPEAPEAIPEDITSDTPTPREAPRVAPDPIAPPEPDAQVAEEVQEAATPEAEGEVVAEEEAVETSPEEATTEIVTEAEDAPPSGAVATSLRPQARPTRPTPPAETETADAEPEAAPAPEPEEDPLAAALTEALESAPSVPTGPPLTSGERDALRVSVSRCWNVGSLSTEALGTTVVVAVDMGRDARPNNASIQLLSSSGGSTTAAQQAFEAARRAIIRCGASGFDLPPEKYDQWRQIEMTFNPEQMRIR